jgi:sugar phosphate permease
MPPVMALLLQAVPARRAGVASGVFSTSRQVGGALAVAVFGALLASRATFVHGVRVSLLSAAAVALAATAIHTSSQAGGMTSALIRARVPSSASGVPSGAK